MSMREEFSLLDGRDMCLLMLQLRQHAAEDQGLSLRAMHAVPQLQDTLLADRALHQTHMQATLQLQDTLSADRALC